MQKDEDLCYFPTQRLCSLKGRLDDGFFPEDTDSIFKQEIKTYSRFDGGIKVATHTREFVDGQHHDCRKTEIMRCR